MDYTTIPSSEIVQKTADSLKANNFEPIIVTTKEEALAKIKELIPAGASVMNGASTTLEQIGYIEYLKSGRHGWDNLHEKILNEKDPAMQSLLRRQMVVSDFYLGSAHAVSQTGELVFGSNTGSQLPGLAFTASNLILVVGTHKITPTLGDALARLNGYVTEREDERLVKVHGVHTIHAKTLILHKENPSMGRKVRIILVNEVLGF